MRIQLLTINIRNSFTRVSINALNVKDKPSNRCTDGPVKSQKCILESGEKVSLTMRRVRRCH